MSVHDEPRDLLGSDYLFIGRTLEIFKARSSPKAFDEIAALTLSCSRTLWIVPFMLIN